MGVLNELFGPSIRLLVLDLFLENPDRLMNLREVARLLGKNPGSVSRVLPRLVEDGLLEQVKIGKNIYAYRLNLENEVVRLLQEFQSRLKQLRIKEGEVSSSKGEEGGQEPRV